MVEPYLKLKGLDSIHQDSILNNLLYGLIDFFDYGVLMLGGYQNISRTPQVSGVYGGQRYKLRPVVQNGFTNGQVWEGFRGNWVWQTGIPEVSVQPIIPTGVWIGSTFHPTTGISNPHYIDYPRGRVIFNTAIATTSVVTTEFSPKWIRFEPAESETTRKLMFDSWDVQRSDYLLANSGNWSDNYDNRIQLPVVGVEASNRCHFIPYQLGGGQWVNQDVNFYVIADNINDKNQITDIIRTQNDRLVWIPNRSLMKADANYPLSLDYRGTPVSGAKQYPDLVLDSGGYRWNGVYLTDTISYDLKIPNPSLFGSVVKITVQIVIENI